MSEREELEKAMAALDQQRTVLGDAAVEAALAGLQQKLSALDQGAPASSEQTSRPLDAQNTRRQNAGDRSR